MSNDDTVNRFALLVLESPWWEPKRNKSRPTCLHFLQGVEKLSNNFNIYNSIFYELRGFVDALTDISETNEKRQILYIGAHGQKAEIANARASTVISKIGEIAKNVESIIISSCFVGSNIDNLRAAFTNSKKVRWVIGYKASVNWLTSTLIESAIISELSRYKSSNYDPKDQKQVINILSDALSIFNPLSVAGEDENESSVNLMNCLVVLHRRGGVSEPEDISSKIWKSHEQR